MKPTRSSELVTPVTGEREYRKRWQAADRRLFEVGRKLDILGQLHWPEDIRHKFFHSISKKNTTLPHFDVMPNTCSKEREELADIQKELEGDHPVPKFLRAVVQSFQDALSMLECKGSSRFTDLSIALYGSTRGEDDPRALETVKLAKRFLRAFRNFHEENLVPSEAVCILGSSVASEIRKEISRVFPNEVLSVSLTNEISAKAVANIHGVRIRESTCFAPHDILQLLNHELFVHTLTLLNGRAQPYQTFGISSPYTTLTQEGLAVFSEFVTNSIDIGRIARLSARVVAIDMALKGASFVDVFRYFRLQRQSEEESYFSAQRIFRGGNGNEGVVFTKDLVYIRGLLEVRRFLLDALETESYSSIDLLFSGRVDLQHIPELVPLLESGELIGPTYLPDWMQNRSNVLTYLLSFAAFQGLKKK